MATGVHLYMSTDASAPVCAGTTGSLVTVLDAVLLNGYGSSAAVSWSCPYSATNKRIYKPAAGNQLLLRVDDNATGTGGAKEALLRGAESASDVDTLTNPMPTDAQSALTAHSLIARKSTAASSTARPWFVLADSRTIYMFVKTGDDNGDGLTYYLAWAFGDFYSNIGGDPWRTFLIARTNENSTVVSNDRLDFLKTGSFAAVAAGHFIIRNRNASVGALNAQKADALAQCGQYATLGTGTAVPFPNPDDGGLYLRPVWLNDPTTATASSVRGRLRGFWSLANLVTALNDGDTWSGVGDLAGRTFRLLKWSGSSGAYVIETSDTWDTSS